MQLVSTPLLTLDTTIDFILTDAGAAVFNGSAFERFIQDPEDIGESLESTIDELSLQIPLSDSVIETLKSKGIEKPFDAGSSSIPFLVEGTLLP